MKETIKTVIITSDKGVINIVWKGVNEFEALGLIEYAKKIILFPEFNLSNKADEENYIG